MSAAPRVSGVVLGAGRSTRTHPLNKLVQPVLGAALATHIVDAVLATPMHERIVVTGHESDQLRAALSGRPVRFVHNPDFASGLASSIRCGVQAVSDDSDGVLICLADMPQIRDEHLMALLDAFARSGGNAVCVPTFGPTRGNPVVWPRAAFAALQGLRGDVGGRTLLPQFAERITWIAMPDAAVLRDVDTAETLAACAQAREPS